MASAFVNTHVSTKETTNYARLCRLLVHVGSQALRDTFDKIHPPASLHDMLSSHTVRASLERLYKEKYKILSPIQWVKLFPSNPSPVSSRNFDITLLMLLLRNFSGLKPPATGWNSPPPPKDTSTEADIIRVRVFRDEIFDHARKAYVEDHAFSDYWQDIQQTLIRLGGERYGPFIDELKVECMDPEIGLHYQELLKQWKEDESRIDQFEGNVGCFYAEAVDISPLEDLKMTLKEGIEKENQKSVYTYLPSRKERKTACGTTENPLNKDLNLRDVSAKKGVNRITSKMFYTEETQKVNKMVVALLDEAINLQQSDHIAPSREKLQCVLQTVKDLGQRFLSNPTKDGLRVLRRGKKLFLEDSMCCSAKHGTLLLDSSSSGAQFYSSLLNVIGAFAVVISEFKMAQETYSLLIDFHQQSAVTCRKRSLGAAYNNSGCISLIIGDLQGAECDFKTSLKHLESARERHQLYSPPLETTLIAINSNIGRLHLLSRNYSEAIEKQALLVETCKAKEVKKLPLQIVFTLLNNLAVSYTTLGKFSKAEHELKWMVSYCKKNRKDCDLLLNFVRLHLSEVLLFHGKPKEAEKAFPFSHVDAIDLVEMFGGLHINVIIETVEKLVDVIVLKGKIRFACELLETYVNILENTFGPDHFNVASLLYKQGTILTLAGKVSSAEEKFKRSMKILEEIFGIKHLLLLKCYMSLGELALRSDRPDESYFYFQRAMENIEAIYQVSFVNQLSRAYLEITSSSTFHQSKMLEDTCKIEGLVAEHGVVLAVLLSRPVPQDDVPHLSRTKSKLKQHLSRNNREVQCPDSTEIVFLKYTSDFLQTGQIFLRQGKKKEAAAFFQQARKYSMGLDAIRGPAYACTAHLYDLLTKKRLGNQETLENKHEMFTCLKELNEASAKISNEISSKRSTEEATSTASTMATSDDQLNLKLVLIFLILLSIELKMIDTTFAAYDLYCRISQNDDGFLHVLNGEVQVYASKTSISCDGKTALQDFLVSSTVGLNEIDLQRPLPEDELYRSLAFKKNAQTDSFLVAYTSSVFLDIEELQALDRKVSLSVQECFQQKCFKAGVEGSATQVVVDLTTTASTCHHRNLLLTGSRVELLSLCLLQGAIGEIPQGGNISEITTAMFQKTFRFAFKDEQTSYFMFSKNCLYLLQQCSSVEISTLSVQHHCLSLTITRPVKARVTLWRKDRSISQKIQFVQTKTRKDMADWTVPRQGCSAELEGDFAVAERLFLPAINHLANAYQVLCNPVEYIDEPPDVSDVHCEQNGFLLDGRHPKEGKVVSLRMEKSETLRENLNAIILEKLTIVSELSCQLPEDAKQEGDNDFAAERHRVNRCRLPTSSQSQFEQEVTSSECSIQPSTLIPETNIQSQHSSFEAPNLAGEEETSEARETYPTLREEEDDTLLGRRLFENDRDSRRSLITELHHEMTRKSNLISQEDGPSDELTQQVGNRVIDPENATTCHTATSHNDLARKDITNSSFENCPLNPNLMEEQSISHQKDDEDALDRHQLEKDTQSTGSSIAESKSSKKEKVFPTWNNKIHANEDSVEDQGLYENQQFESSPVPGQSARMAKDEVKQRLTGTAMNDSRTQIRTENVTFDNQYRSNYLSSTSGQTQHLQDVTERQTKHTILQGENHQTSSPMEIVEEYIFQQRDERESRGGQNEPLVHKDFPQAFTIPNLTKREKSRSSFNDYGDTVPDGPITTSNGMHDSSTDLMPSRYTDVVDGPLKRVGNNLQIQSGLLSENTNGILTSRRQIVDETNCEELHPGARRNEKLRASQQSRKFTSLRNPQLAFLGGDVLVDGGATDSLRKEDKMVNGPALTDEAFTTCQDGTEGICKNEMKPFLSDASRDAVDGRVYSLRSEDLRGFGGARPKQISPSSTKTKTKITEAISPYPHNETGEIGLKPGFLARHTVKGNGAIVDLPPQDGWNEPNFSAESWKNITYSDNLQLPVEGLNPPGYTSISSSQGLYAQAAFAARTSTKGTTQLAAIHQEPSLNQKESWHFPPPESPNDDQSLCVGQQNVSQSENSFISNVKELFSSHGSRNAYDEMDSMSDEYQSSMRHVENAMVESPAASYSHYSSTKDSTSSLLGSLQQIMSKTVNLIASSNVVAMQPQKEPKEAVKLSIQEEARGGREQEPAVRTGVEDSRNQEESTQENGKTESQPIQTPVQETPRPVCNHYQRRCLVRFPCCGKFYPCHRCHNESKDCSDDQARATNATHIRCSICYNEQVIDEQSQTCGGCKSKMSEYFCSTCKHFTSVDKNPFHCDKCGICRIHRDRSFHCDVCNVCLDKRLQGKHKCRPDSGHDECCICLEDAFSGCQILPCSHKVHKDCAIAMIQNGVRSCPICRHPLFSQTQNSPQ